MGKTHENTRKMALLVQRVVDEHYESGRQDRSKERVYRTVVRKVYPMSRSTFYRYLRRAKECKQSEAPPPRRQSLTD